MTASGTRATMPAKIRREMPLPMPWSDSSSPIHITAIEPAVSVVTTSKASKKLPEKIPRLPSHAVIPTPCTTAKSTEP